MFSHSREWTFHNHLVLWINLRWLFHGLMVSLLAALMHLHRQVSIRFPSISSFLTSCRLFSWNHAATLETEALPSLLRVSHSMPTRLGLWPSLLTASFILQSSDHTMTSRILVTALGKSSIPAISLSELTTSRHRWIQGSELLESWRVRDVRSPQAFRKFLVSQSLTDS